MKIELKHSITPLLIIMLGFVFVLLGNIEQISYIGFAGVPFIIWGVVWCDRNERHNNYVVNKLYKELKSYDEKFKTLDCQTKTEVGKCKTRISEIEKQPNIKGKIVASEKWIKENTNVK